jgi:hypothetical protein
MTSGVSLAGPVDGGLCRRYERSTPFDVKTATEVVPGAVTTGGGTGAVDGGAVDGGATEGGAVDGATTALGFFVCPCAPLQAANIGTTTAIGIQSMRRATPRG